MILLRSSIVTKLGGSHAWTTLHQCLLHWINNASDPTPHKILAHSIPKQIRNTLNAAITEQTLIGWEPAFQGFLSTKWLTAQHHEHQRSSTTGLKSQWLQPVIQAIWKVALSHWDTRNKILYSKTDQSQQIRESSLNAKVRKLHKNQDQFAASDRVLFISLSTFD
jgi:hypothetical protein